MPPGRKIKSIQFALLAVLLAFAGVAGFFFVLAAEAKPVLASVPGDTASGTYAITSTTSSLAAPLESAVTERIHPSLWKQVSQAVPDEKIPVIIEWRTIPFESLVAGAITPSILGQSAVERRAAVIAVLQENARLRSGELQSVLSQAQDLGAASQVRAFWSSPVIAARAEPAFIAALSQRPDIVQIRPDERFQIEADLFTPSPSNTAASAVQGNLAMVQAPLVWDALGLDGSGVVVANLDTGVDWQHPALLSHYRGYNPNGPSSHLGNWFVATDEPYLYPGDGYGHGTHTMGTMVGDDRMGNRTGVAPGAKWIAVKVFDNQGYTYESWIHSAFEWVLAPAGNPALAPNVVNCSWGSPLGSDDRFRPDVTVLRQSGILPVFSAGNNGPYAGTVGSPSSFPESFAVGAVDEFKDPATFSSRGPSSWGEVKPEISAPGVQVRSTFPGGGYRLSNGTSMAAPHVAGVVALLLQADPALSPDELESILLTSAEPLGDVVPNNRTGWGLVNAYAAALQVTHSGEVSGSVHSASGNSLPYATVTARTHPEILPPRAITISVTSQGDYLLALQPGRYELTAQAFGYYPQKLASLVVLTATQHTINFVLNPLPVGRVVGHVTDLENGAPLPAVLSVPGTPIQAQTNPVDGSFDLALPAGEWRINIEASSIAPHRLGHITPTLSAGQVLIYEIALPASPRILLVDSGQWYYDSQIAYYAAALQSLDFSYSLWPIRHLGLAGEPDDRPTPGDLAPYDMVIWADPQGSPGYIGVSSVISDFLGQGGNILLSGQSIAELDGGGSPYGYAWYMYQLMGLSYYGGGQLDPLDGVPGSPLAGVHVALNTSDSARQQTSVDAAQINDPTLTYPALVWDDGTIGGAVAGICTPFRAAWLGFGLEGAGPDTTRAQILSRLIDWSQLPAEPYGLHLAYDPSTLIGGAGETITREIKLVSTGVLTDVINITVSGGSWPILVKLPDGTVFDDQAALTLPGCGQELITVTVTIPAGEPIQSFSHYTIDLISHNKPSIERQVSLTAKTPAPVLLMEAQRWFDNTQLYVDALEANNIPFDLLGGVTPFQMYLYPDLLERYAVVIWTTGYNWFDPLNTYSRDALASYLENGGRLLISGQDVLDTSGDTLFTRDFLGIQDFTLSVTSTEMQPVVGSPLGHDIELQQLVYSFNNWSDGIQPSLRTGTISMDGRLYPNGVKQSGENWRTIFYSFPLETLNPDTLSSVLRRSLAWLSPIGTSSLQAPNAAAAGSVLPVTLTLRLDEAFPPQSISAVLPIPPGAGLQPGSLQGAWDYQADINSLVWQGVLSHPSPQVFSARMVITDSLPTSSHLPLKVRLSTADGAPIIIDRSVSIGTPWIEVQASATTQVPQPGEVFTISLSLANLGVIPGIATITLSTPGADPASLLLRPITSTEWVAASGQVWSINLLPGAAQMYTFRALVPTSMGRLPLRIDVSDSYHLQMTGLVFEIYYRHLFPVVFNGIGN